MDPKQVINIAFKSYNHYYIKNSLLHLSKCVQKWNLSVLAFKHISLPSHKRKITLLKSPHVHKKSREQFELVQKKSCITIHSSRQKDALAIILILFYSQFPGTECQCTLKYNTSVKRRTPVGSAKEKQ